MAKARPTDGYAAVGAELAPNFCIGDDFLSPGWVAGEGWGLGATFLDVDEIEESHDFGPSGETCGNFLVVEVF